MIEVEDITYATPDGRILASGLSFGVSAGELLAIRGPNGSGKTTLLQLLLRQRQPIAGQIKWHIARHHFAYLPQLQNVRFHLPLTLADVLSMAIGRKIMPADVEPLGILAATDLASAWNSASGGERQRTLICRALLQKPRIFFLDEPFNHLDEASFPRVAKALQAFLEQPGRAVVLVTHGSLAIEHLSGEHLRTLDLGSS